MAVVPIVPLVPMAAKGIATYIGTEVVVDVASRLIKGQFLDDLKSGKLLDDAVSAAKEMVSNPLDTAMNTVKSQLGMKLFSSVGTLGKAAIIGAEIVMSDDKPQPQMKNEAFKMRM